MRKILVILLLLVTAPASGQYVRPRSQFDQIVSASSTFNNVWSATDVVTLAARLSLLDPTNPQDAATKNYIDNLGLLTNPLTADLDMGGFDILNANNVTSSTTTVSFPQSIYVKATVQAEDLRVDDEAAIKTLGGQFGGGDLQMADAIDMNRLGVKDALYVEAATLRSTTGTVTVAEDLLLGSELAALQAAAIYFKDTSMFIRGVGGAFEVDGSMHVTDGISTAGDVTLSGEGDLKFSDTQDSYVHLNAVGNLETYVEAVEVIEAASNAVYFRKPVWLADIHASGGTGGGGRIQLFEGDGTGIDGIYFGDDSQPGLVNITAEYGLIVTTKATLSGTAQLASASVTGNLEVGGTLEIDGPIVTTGSGPALLIGGGASLTSHPTGSGGQVTVWDLDGAQDDGVTFWDDSARIMRLSAEGGLVLENDAAGFTNEATALFSATATFDAPVVLTANSGIQMATKAWSRLLTAFEIECATRGSEPGLLVPSGGTAARFQGDGKVRIPLPMPNDILGGNLRLTKVVVQVATGHASSYITASRPWKMELLDTYAFGSPLASEDTSDTGNGSTGTALRQVYDAPTGAPAGPIAGFYLELTSAGTASGSVDVGGIYYEGVIQ